MEEPVETSSKGEVTRSPDEMSVMDAVKAEMPELAVKFGLNDQQTGLLMDLYTDELRLVHEGRDSEPKQDWEVPLRNGFRKKIVLMPRAQREAVLQEIYFTEVPEDVPPQGRPEGPLADPPVPKGRVLKCGKCRRDIEFSGPTAQCPNCGTTNRPATEAEEFDAALARLGDGKEGFLSALFGDLSGFGQGMGGGHSASWYELDRLPEKPLEETPYMTMDASTRARENRKWASLARLRSARPSKPVRYELVKLFGSTRRAKVFYTWVRASTSQSHTEAWRWNRCHACGGDLAFSALYFGDVECQDCGALNDTTIHGDEQFSDHVPFAVMINVNNMQAVRGRPYGDRPDVEITRPNQDTPQ